MGRGCGRAAARRTGGQRAARSLNLYTLENGGIRTTLMNAVEAATRRSRELGEALLKRSD